MKPLVIITALFCSLGNPCFSQYNFNACTTNVVANDTIYINNLQGFSNMILLQSGTQLEINRFGGYTTFVHGHKALENDDNFSKPTLIINKCFKGYKLSIDHKRINAVLGPSCRQRRPEGYIGLFTINSKQTKPDQTRKP